ncbi:ABC transporter ATP-binding protein [Thermodesulfobacteriota bacterium]
MNLLEVNNLKTYFYTRWGTVKAVDGVTFSLKKGEALGVVGESGCGKTITGLSIMRLVPKPAGKIISGEILLEGENLLTKNEEDIRKIRGQKLSMILQDPMSSLNPVLTIGNQLTEGIKYNLGLSGIEVQERAMEVLRMVRMATPEVYLRRWPHQLSGGMRQRVVGAIGFACRPSLLIADEPTTSLDTTIRLQFLHLLHDLQVETGLGLIFITHDLGIVARMCQRVMVMYAGKVVETADVRTLFNHPAHPYTQALLNAVPNVDADVSRLASIEGQPPPLYDLPHGCAFAPRCSSVEANCTQNEPPPIKEIAEGQRVACWKYINGV